jgi:hypothetical protein
VYLANLPRKNQGQEVQYLGVNEMYGINPLLINLRRAQELRYIKKLDQLDIPGIEQLLDNRDPGRSSIGQNEHSTSEFQSLQPVQRSQQFNATITMRRDINIRVAGENDDLSQGARLNRVLRSQVSQIVRSIPNSGSQPPQYRVLDAIHDEENDEATRNKRGSSTQSSGQPTSQCRSLTINGNNILFANSDVQFPVGVVSFAEDIRRSLRAWDDDSRVQLKGIPVPVRLWATLFKGIRPAKSWDTIKKAYSELKVRSSVTTRISLITLVSSVSSKMLFR